MVFGVLENGFGMDWSGEKYVSQDTW